MKGTTPITKKRQRILAKSGTAYSSIPVTEVVCFTTSDKVVYAVLRNGKRYQVESRLSQLEAELDPLQFFRINRQYLFNVDFLQAFLPCKGGQLLLRLSVEGPGVPLLVSQYHAPAFKTWIFSL